MYKTIKYNILIVLVLIIIVEIFLWFIPVPDPYSNIKVQLLNNKNENKYIESQFERNLNLKFSTEKGLLGFENYKKNTDFTINNFGFRGDNLTSPKPKNEYRIFAIGGSTTENLYIDDNDSWPYLLQNKLNQNKYNNNIKVYNAGKSGDNIQDHIAMLSHRIIHLNPDEIILFCGVNDITRLILDGNPLKFYKNSQTITSNSFLKMLRFFSTEFQIPRRLFYVLKTQNEVFTQITGTSDYKSKTEKAKSLKNEKSIPKIDYQNFKQKLEVFIGICKSKNIKLNIITQVTTWDTKDKNLLDWQWMTVKGDVRYSNLELQFVMDSINLIQVKTANKFNIPILEANKKIQKNGLFFYDDCHFNPNGNKKFAEELTNFMTTLNNHNYGND